MSTVAFDVDAVRARFSALQGPTAFFDGPGGTQCPDSVIDAIAGYLRESNANLGGAFAASRRSDALLELAHITAASFLGCAAEETIFGQNMTTLNFMLTRTLGRTLRAGDEILVTRLDHDGNVSPWLELAHDLDLKVRFVDVHDDTTLDLHDLEWQLTERTRVVAFPLASNAVGTLVDARRGSPRSHTTRAHWLGRTPSTSRHMGRSTSTSSASTCCSARRTSSSGRTSASRSGAPSCSSAGGRTRCGRRDEVSAAGSRRGRSRTSCSRASSPPSSTSTRSAGRRSEHERALGERFLAGLPERCTLHGLRRWTGACRRSRSQCRRAHTARRRRAARRAELAVWDGDYYAVEVMQRLGLAPDGAVRAGFIHYNTADEVDRLLGALAEL